MNYPFMRIILIYFIIADYALFHIKCHNIRKIFVILFRVCVCTLTKEGDMPIRTENVILAPWEITPGDVTHKGNRQEQQVLQKNLLAT